MKFVKKLTALFLAIVMTMAMGITAFAAEGDVTLSIKDPVAGHTYKVYQIVTGDVDGLSNGSATLSNVKKGSSLKNADSYADGDAVLNELRVDKADSESAFLTGEALGNAAYKLIDTGKQVDSLSTEKTSITVAKGYYIIVDEYSENLKGDNVVYSRNMVAVVGDTEVTPKTETPKIDKEIIDTDANVAIDDSKKTDTAAIGDVINYQVTGSVPNMTGYTYYYYVLDDTLSKGLTLDKNSFSVTIGSKTLTTSEYTVDVTSETEGGETKFQLGIVDLKTMEGINAGDTITIKYNATVNKYAEIGTTANTNTAVLKFSNNPNASEQKDKTGKPGIPDSSVPTGETPDQITKTYVTQINLFKVDQDGMPLKGAEFTLSGTNLNEVIIKTTYTFAEDAQGAYWKLKDGTYTTEAPKTEVKDDNGNVTQKSNEDLYESTTQKYSRTVVVATETTKAQDSKVTVTVDNNGYATFTGLNEGSYTLKETKTPDGYNTVSDITFTITRSQTGSTAEVGGNISWDVSGTDASKVTKVGDGTFAITIENQKGSILPSTGGMGTTVIYMAGIAMIVAAGIVVIVRKRMA